MIIQFLKTYKDARMPTKANKGDAGWDLYYSGDSGKIFIDANTQRLINTGIKIAIPHGWCGIIKSRSGLSLNKSVAVKAGVIDCAYRNNIGVILRNESSRGTVEINPGDKIAQMLIIAVPEVEWIENESELPESERGERGFGSSGT